MLHALHLILKSSVSVLPAPLYMGTHPFFQQYIHHISWLCFNALQIYLLRHLGSLNRHTGLSSVYRHTHTKLLLSLHVRRPFYLSFQPLPVWGQVYMYQQKCLFYSILVTEKKSVCSSFQTHKLFWFNAQRKFQSREKTSEKPKAMEMEHYNSSN